LEHINSTVLGDAYAVAATRIVNSSQNMITQERSIAMFKLSQGLITRRATYYERPMTKGQSQWRRKVTSSAKSRFLYQPYGQDRLYESEQ